mgnify:CR=1 FL=1|tara:strand:+ start:2461 stop:3360 length:900 start_codon:yes stop_codon:yes gene_type:complete
MKSILILILSISFSLSDNSPYLIILGIAQDGGAPQAGCKNLCCKDKWENGHKENVSCLAIIDPKSGKSWIIDATPDFPTQYKIVTEKYNTELEGIFLTHAHIGHYTGLIHLGKEVMGTKNIKVFAMPKMQSFLKSNGPWEQLINLKNIQIKSMKNDREIRLADRLFIEPFLVPHRDEYSETIGLKIIGPKKSVLYIPDIDKWEKWDQNIFELIQHIDYALIDGTFYSENELPNRNMQDIPHPLIVESIDLLYNLNSTNRNKVHFIHFNHSNPAIMDGAVTNDIRSKRFNVAREGMILKL